MRRTLKKRNKSTRKRNQKQPRKGRTHGRKWGGGDPYIPTSDTRRESEKKIGTSNSISEERTSSLTAKGMHFGDFGLYKEQGSPSLKLIKAGPGWLNRDDYDKQDFAAVWRKWRPDIEEIDSFFAFNKMPSLASSAKKLQLIRMIRVIDSGKVRTFYGYSPKNEDLTKDSKEFLKQSTLPKLKTEVIDLKTV